MLTTGEDLLGLPAAQRLRPTKKWSGLLKEGFTDADNFGVMFPKEWESKLKALFLGAVFLIDFVHFENKSNN